MKPASSTHTVRSRRALALRCNSSISVSVGTTNAIFFWPSASQRRSVSGSFDPGHSHQKNGGVSRLNRGLPGGQSKLSAQDEYHLVSRTYRRNYWAYSDSRSFCRAAMR